MVFIVTFDGKSAIWAANHFNSLVNIANTKAHGMKFFCISVQKLLYLSFVFLCQYPIIYYFNEKFILPCKYGYLQFSLLTEIQPVLYGIFQNRLYNQPWHTDIQVPLINFFSHLKHFTKTLGHNI